MPRLPALSAKEAEAVQKDLGIDTDNMGGTLPKSVRAMPNSGRSRPSSRAGTAISATFISAIIFRFAACHGVRLEGQPNWRSQLANGSLPAPPHDETGHTWHHPDQLLFDITKHGGAKNAPAGFVSGMPAFGGKLADRDIWAALAYIKSRPAPDDDQRTGSPAEIATRLGLNRTCLVTARPSP